MFYLILSVGFIAVFVLIGWCIFKTQRSAKPPQPDRYVCTECNDYHCDCHKEHPAD